MADLVHMILDTMPSSFSRAMLKCWVGPGDEANLQPPYN